MKARTLMIYLSIINEGDWDKIFCDITTRKDIPSDAEQIVEATLRDNGIKALTLLDENYPAHLKTSYKPPFVLYYIGDISLINKKCLSIIGCEKPHLDFDTAEAIIKDTSRVIVTGNSRGIEQKVILTAIKYRKPCIVILNTDSIAMQVIVHCTTIKDVLATGGLIISEHFDHSVVVKGNDLYKNRIIIGMSEKLLIPEIIDDPESTISITMAIEKESEVYVLPTAPGDHSVYNNELIKLGAILTTGILDLEGGN